MNDQQQHAADVREFALEQDDCLSLLGLTKSPGFPVLVKMMETACQRAYARVIHCDPTEEDKVCALQKEARAASAFCELLRKAINWNTQRAASFKKEVAA